MLGACRVVVDTKVLDEGLVLRPVVTDSWGVFDIFWVVVPASLVDDSTRAGVVRTEDVIDFISFDTCVAEGGFEVRHVSTHGLDCGAGVGGLFPVSEGGPGVRDKLRKSDGSGFGNSVGVPAGFLLNSGCQKGDGEAADTGGFLEFWKVSLDGVTSVTDIGDGGGVWCRNGVLAGFCFAGGASIRT